MSGIYSFILGALAYFLCFHSLAFGLTAEEGIATSLFVTLLVFLPHELGHVIVGRGQFRFNPVFTLLSMILTYFKIPFILVGYSDVRSTKAVLAGPLANIIMALFALFLASWDSKMMILVYPNIYYATTNLLPLPPLDGAIICREKPLFWLLLFVPLLFLTFAH